MQHISTTLWRCKRYNHRRQQEPKRELASHRVTTRRNADDNPQDSFKHLQTINIERRCPQPHVCHHLIIVLHYHSSQQLPSLSSHQWTGHKVLYCISIDGSPRYCLRHIDKLPCFRLRRSRKGRQSKRRGAMVPSRKGCGAVKLSSLRLALTCVQRFLMSGVDSCSPPAPVFQPGLLRAITRTITGTRLCPSLFATSRSAPRSGVHEGREVLLHSTLRCGSCTLRAGFHRDCSVRLWECRVK